MNNTCNQHKEHIEIFLENNTRDQYKEHIKNIIKELRQEINLIENKVDELCIFYITNKGKYDNYELAKTFFKNLKDFIEKERIKDTTVLRYGGCGELYFIRYYTDFSSYIISNYLQNTICAHSTTSTTEQIKESKELANRFFNIICNEEEEKLFFKMLFFEKKLKYYENKLGKLYPELYKPVIKHTMELSLECEKSLIENKQYSILVSVIILILTVLYVMTVVLFVKYNL